MTGDQHAFGIGSAQHRRWRRHAERRAERGSAAATVLRPRGGRGQIDLDVEQTAVDLRLRRAQQGRRKARLVRAGPGADLQRHMRVRNRSEDQLRSGRRPMRSRLRNDRRDERRSGKRGTSEQCSDRACAQQPRPTAGAARYPLFSQTSHCAPFRPNRRRAINYFYTLREGSRTANRPPKQADSLTNCLKTGIKQP